MKLQTNNRIISKRPNGKKSFRVSEYSSEGLSLKLFSGMRGGKGCHKDLCVHGCTDNVKDIHVHNLQRDRFSLGLTIRGKDCPLAMHLFLNSAQLAEVAEAIRITLSEIA